MATIGQYIKNILSQKYPDVLLQDLKIDYPYYNQNRDEILEAKLIEKASQEFDMSHKKYFDHIREWERTLERRVASYAVDNIPEDIYRILCLQIIDGSSCEKCNELYLHYAAEKCDAPVTHLPFRKTPIYTFGNGVTIDLGANVKGNAIISKNRTRSKRCEGARMCGKVIASVVGINTNIQITHEEMLKDELIMAAESAKVRTNHQKAMEALYS